ncbi:MAG: 3-isopropylmalate dehydratase small subunit, partial [Spirochaetes bacterium]
SFADIFYNNCFKNGMLPVILPQAKITDLFTVVMTSPGYSITIDLEKQKLMLPQEKIIGFDIDPFRKHCLLNGLDDIGLTLEKIEQIRAYEKRQQQETPWLFAES